MNLSSAPIGIFDSGIGGLTVAKAVMELLPEEDIIYFGDTARVPYGIKSVETVRNYALQITRFLLEKKVKMILIACNTVSASAKKEILEMAGEIPVIDVITAGAEVAVSLPIHKQVGVIGTLATVNSNAYEKAIHELDSDATVDQKACPLLVPLAEEGWIDNEVARQTLRTYLQHFDQIPINSLILGCTHYPLFKEVIGDELASRNVNVIDSAESIAEEAKRQLAASDNLNQNGGSLHCFVSDRPQRFEELAERFLGKQLSRIEIVELS